MKTKNLAGAGAAKLGFHMRNRAKDSFKMLVDKLKVVLKHEVDIKILEIYRQCKYL